LHDIFLVVLRRRQGGSGGHRHLVANGSDVADRCTRAGGSRTSDSYATGGRPHEGAYGERGGRRFCVDSF
jgi:hypothetical protein